ncbi:TRAP1 [Lepeophtheirus salmonis]|uniref:Heat shock protein 83 n=1 Tax=Lepeophtheirus salmonis TaxID=72036 RepID=A0A7R8CNS8_LEPSM|nr:TRAP1 [Lepeophtheirus salmonis]CAF2877824.1 TRAP1 [Lepeophtheirus salmonis]
MSLAARRLCSTVRYLRYGSFMGRKSVLVIPHLHRTLMTSFPRSIPTQTQEGPSETYEFKAETQKLLDIVAKSLYSEKEVFVRELISNASDAIEKYRYLSTSGSPDLIGREKELSIHIDTDKSERTLTISDNGIGMTKEELISNLGTIARSGSKAFLEELSKSDNPADSNIIGQFGVGFYSAFMVADKIDVYSSKDGKGYHWSSEGYGSYSITEADADCGTKIVLHLKTDCREFADEETVRGVVKKYSSFVGSPLFLNGNRSNDLRPLWLLDPKEVNEESYRDFYNYISNSFDSPRFIQHFRSEAPMDVKALLFVPDSRPGQFDMSRDKESGVSLYCRKILIKSRMENILPQWMRFVKGVVDCEDIPLNLSRELLQDSALIRKLKNILQNKFLRFMQDKARKETESYMEFYGDYGQFFKEGIITSQDQSEKEEIAKLLRFETSTSLSGESKSLMDYTKNMKEGQKDIYYLAAPSRQLAESSPYFESLKNKEVEILFCYESYDELVLMQLRQFGQYNLVSVEKEMRADTERYQEDEKKSFDSY